MATSTPTTLPSITNYYNILIKDTPSATQLANEAARVNLSTTTLAESLRDLYNSPSRKASEANELAEAFFVLFGRAPDYATYTAAMALLRGGTTFASLMEMALAMPGHQLSNDGLVKHSEWVSTAYTLLTGQQISPADLANYSAMLDQGSVSRGQLLASALMSDNALFHGNRSQDVQTSLLFLSGANQAASQVDLEAAKGNLFSDILLALTAGGFSATSGKPYFIRNSPGDLRLDVQGELTADLFLDLQNEIYTLGGASLFKALYSSDGGFDAGLVAFDDARLGAVQTIDLSQVIGKGKVQITGLTGGGDQVFVGSRIAANTLQGANGNDTLTGGIAADRLVATPGRDVLTGSSGIDTFVFAQATYYRDGSAFTTINDLGNDKDVIDVSRLLGTAGQTAASIKPVLATSTSTAALANGGVALIENNGLWLNASGSAPAPAEKADVAGLFGTSGNAVFLNPTATSRYVILTADLVNGAEVWLINNAVDVKQITVDDITLVGHIDGDWNLMLNQLLPIVK